MNKYVLEHFVEAIQFNGEQDMKSISESVPSAVSLKVDELDGRIYAKFSIMEHTFTLHIGDYLVKSKSGYCIMQKDVFEKNFNLVKE